MNFERMSEQKEMPSYLEKRKTILGLFTKKWNDGHAFPFMPEVVTEDGSKLEKMTEALPGNVSTEAISSKDNLIRSIRTGAGYIAEGKPDLMTKELTGCLGVFVFGKMKNGKPLSALLHMTPSTKLAWGNYRYEDDEKRWGADTRARMSAAIVEALDEAGGDIATCHAILIRTAGYPPNPKKYEGFAEDRQAEKTKDLVENFNALGLKTKVLEPLIMETATVYWSSESPDEIFAVGEKRIPHPMGGVDKPSDDEKGVVSQIVSMRA